MEVTLSSPSNPGPYMRVRLNERAAAELVVTVEEEINRLIPYKRGLRDALEAHWEATKEIDTDIRAELKAVRARLSCLRYILRMAQGARAEKGWLQ